MWNSHKWRSREICPSMECKFRSHKYILQCASGSYGMRGDGKGKKGTANGRSNLGALQNRSGIL